MNKTEFQKQQLTKLADNLKKHKAAFFSTLTQYITPEKVEAIYLHLIKSDNSIGSTSIAPDIKVNIDWAQIKNLNEVFPEKHLLYHDIHIPTFNEGMFIYPPTANLKTIQDYNEAKDISFHYRQGGEPIVIKSYSPLFIPAEVYHAPLYGIYASDTDIFNENDKRYGVKICVKIHK